MKKVFFHKEVILQRGNVAKNFILITKGKALVLDSIGINIKKIISENQTFGLIDMIKENRWKNTIVSENKTEVLFISRDILIKNLFSNRTITGFTLNLLKMAN